MNRELARHVDVMLGNEEDFTAALGFEVPDTDASLRELDVAQFRAHDRRGRRRVPETARWSRRRCAPSAARRVNDWGAIAWSRDGMVSSRATQRDGLEILDRVGGGDSFASGLVYGLLDRRVDSRQASSTARRTARSQ